MRALMLLPPALLAGCAQTPAQVARAADRVADARAGLAEELAGLTPDTGGGGCFNSTLHRGSQVDIEAYGPTILYKVSRDLVYRTDTSGGCEGLARGDALVTRTPSGRQCRGDIATTVDVTARFQTGSCSFGDFVAYRRR